MKNNFPQMPFNWNRMFSWFPFSSFFRFFRCFIIGFNLSNYIFVLSIHLYYCILQLFMNPLFFYCLSWHKKREEIRNHYISVDSRAIFFLFSELINWKYHFHSFIYLFRLFNLNSIIFQLSCFSGFFNKRWNCIAHSNYFSE